MAATQVRSVSENQVTELLLCPNIVEYQRLPKRKHHIWRTCRLNALNWEPVCKQSKTLQNGLGKHLQTVAQLRFFCPENLARPPLV